MTTKSFFGLTVLAALAATTIGCSSGSYCDRTSKCSADPKPTSDQIKACKDTEAAMTKCKTETQNYNNCLADNQVCGTDNTTDFAKTSAPCSSQQTALQKCNQGGSDGGADAS